MNGSEFNAMNGLYECFTLDRHTARELTIRDYKKDCGYGRYVVRGDGEMIYGGNDLGEWFVSPDLPDPRTNWQEMAACILFVALVAVVMVAMLWAV